MALPRETLIVTCILCMSSAWYHELGIEQHLQFYHDHITRGAGQDQYASFLTLSCLPQNYQYRLETPSHTTIRDLLNTMNRCCYNRAKDCFLPEFDTPVFTSCQEKGSLKAPCGHITLRTKHSYSMHNAREEYLFCTWGIIKHRGFAINITVLTLDMPLTSRIIKRPFLGVIQEDNTAEFLYGKGPPITFVSSTSLLLPFYGSDRADMHIRAVYHIIPLPMWREHKNWYENSMILKDFQPIFYSIPNQLLLLHLLMFIGDIVKLGVRTTVVNDTSYKLVVFDGPGHLSRKLQPNCSESNCNFTSRTFHMFVVLGRGQGIGNMTLSYHAELSQFDCDPYSLTTKGTGKYSAAKRMFHISNNDVERAFKSFGCFSCSSRLFQDSDTLWYLPLASVRVEIEHFEYEGFTAGQNSSCMFGGLYIMLHSGVGLDQNQIYDGANNFCHSLAKTHTANISADFEVMLALTVFQGYSKASVKVTVYFSPCQSTFLPWPNRLSWRRLQQTMHSVAAPYEWNFDVHVTKNNDMITIGDTYAVHDCFQLDVYPSNRHQLYLRSSILLSHSLSSRAKQLFNFGSLTSLTVLTRANPFYKPSEREMLRHFATHTRVMPANCFSSFLAKITYFAEFSDVIGKIITLEDRQNVVNIEAYSFVMELSDCPWRESSISITGNKSKAVNEYRIRPNAEINTAMVILGHVFVKEMVTEGLKAVFVGMNGTWQFQYQPMYDYSHFDDHDNDTYVIDVFTLYYRGYCPETSTVDSITVQLITRENYISTDYTFVWSAMPRSPHVFVWKISRHALFFWNMDYYLELDREVSGKSYLTPACDIMMTVWSETEPVSSNCELNPEFFYLENGKCYHIQSEVSQTWYEAQSYCETKGASLASLDSAHELHLLQRALEPIDRQELDRRHVLFYSYIIYIGLRKEVGLNDVEYPR